MRKKTPRRCEMSTTILAVTTLDDDEYHALPDLGAVAIEGVYRVDVSDRDGNESFWLSLVTDGSGNYGTDQKVLAGNPFTISFEENSDSPDKYPRNNTVFARVKRVSSNTVYIQTVAYH
jgi:hypothetical protein